jgi:hypothetical protein
MWQGHRIVKGCPVNTLRAKARARDRAQNMRTGTALMTRSRCESCSVNLRFKPAWVPSPCAGLCYCSACEGCEQDVISRPSHFLSHTQSCARVRQPCAPAQPCARQSCARTADNVLRTGKALTRSWCRPCPPVRSHIARAG